jgi:hypothetical protein
MNTSKGENSGTMGAGATTGSPDGAWGNPLGTTALKAMACRGLGPVLGACLVDCSAIRRLSSATSPLNDSMTPSAARKRRLNRPQSRPPNQSPRPKNSAAVTTTKMALLAKKYSAASRLFKRSEMEATRAGMERGAIE